MANDFSNDPNCVAVWRFEDSPGFTADSQGSNTLTNSGADEETTTVFEGSQSAKFVRSNADRMYIADADQDAGFPWRYADSGSMEKNLSICFRVYFNSLPSSIPANFYFICRYDAVAGNYRVFAVKCDLSDNTIRFIVGYNGGASYEQVSFGVAVQTGRWYSVGITYDNSDYSYRIRIYDHTAGDFLGSDATGNFSQDIDPVDIGFSLGGYYGD